MDNNLKVNNSNYLVPIKKKRKIVGRGIGSGRGKTCGRGGKGQTARSGGGPKPGLKIKGYFRFPKRGGRIKTGKVKEVFYQIINLGKLEKDQKIASGQTVDLTQEKPPVKVLSEGELTKALTITAAAFSKPAQKKIVKVGGKFQIVTK